ncbi:MAG: response regulator, partial [Acidobacteria bacterium]|nr:response regulator [Acidobacteriota bacterium]
NLISNAIKFTPEGEVSLWVTQHHGEGPESPEASGAERLLFAIKDTGIGIPPEAAKRIFEPFAQLDSSRARKYAGSGLGLTITKRLVELMGGNIWVESGSSGGSTFFFTLTVPTPLRLPGAGRARPAAIAAPEKPPALDTTLADRLPLRILVADDDFTNRKVAALILRSLGYAADVVDDGAKAVAAVREVRYDVLFMDLRMPDMDGLEATRRILEACGDGGRPRIIAMTASALGEDRQRCLAAGMDDFISKPVLPDVVRETLLRWCGEGSKPPSAPPEASASPKAAGRLDPGTVAMLRDMGALESVARIFAEEQPPRQAEAREALEQGDYPRLVFAAHTSAGAAAAIG